MDEQAAVQASKDGDREAFSVPVDRYHQSIYRFAYGCIGNHQDADDVCQETSAKVLDKIHGLKDGDRFEAADDAFETAHALEPIDTMLPDTVLSAMWRVLS